MKKTDRYIVVSALVAIGVLAVVFLRKPKESSEAKIRRLKLDSFKKLMDLKIQRSLTTDFDTIVKIDAQIDTIKNRLKSQGITDAITEMEISQDLTKQYNKI